ncbi:MAG: glycosyl transferase family 1, partial [Candidatus Poribacteria bacterium]|nr:glycosyl transferase family 1 [Candidatus Poribacteria bacterium]
SSLGAMGLDAKVGESLLVGDTPEAFAKQIIDLIESPDFRQAVGTSGRRLVERKYCWDVLVNQLEGVYSQICH